MGKPVEFGGTVDGVELSIDEEGEDAQKKPQKKSEKAPAKASGGRGSAVAPNGIGEGHSSAVQPPKPAKRRGGKLKGRKAASKPEIPDSKLERAQIANQAFQPPASAAPQSEQPLYRKLSFPDSSNGDDRGSQPTHDQARRSKTDDGGDFGDGGVAFGQDWSGEHIRFLPNPP